MALRIVIGTIKHEDHRYPTVGDWQPTENGLVIRVSDMNNSDYEFLLALHELVEAYLCQKRGISEADVTEFDVMFEKNRREDDFSEPGDDKAAPYYKEHQFATVMERRMAKELGVNWKKYDRAVAEL